MKINVLYVRLYKYIDLSCIIGSSIFTQTVQIQSYVKKFMFAYFSNTNERGSRYYDGCRKGSAVQSSRFKSSVVALAPWMTRPQVLDTSRVSSMKMASTHAYTSLARKTTICRLGASASCASGRMWPMLDIISAPSSTKYIS